MMHVNMFESDRACGPQLWWFGLVVLAMGVVHSCGGAGEGGGVFFRFSPLLVEADVFLQTV
jgi:hypothetical protein